MLQGSCCCKDKYMLTYALLYILYALHIDKDPKQTEFMILNAGYIVGINKELCAYSGGS